MIAISRAAEMPFSLKPKIINGAANVPVNIVEIIKKMTYAFLSDPLAIPKPLMYYGRLHDRSAMPLLK